jgi:hypothetical protein
MIQLSSTWHNLSKGRATAAVLLAMGLAWLLVLGYGNYVSSVTRQGPAKHHARQGEKATERVDFSFHVRPILSDRCFACHDPDKTKVKSGLQLNRSESAFLNLAQADEPNRYAIVPGDLESSELWKRISAVDPDYRMPPANSNKKPLSKQEQDTIRRWIEQGAEYKEHWAFVPPVKPPQPALARGRRLLFRMYTTLLSAYPTGVSWDSKSSLSSISRR